MTPDADEVEIEIQSLDPEVCATVELLDVGSGARGGSLLSAQNRFGVPGIGLERWLPAVRRAQAAGLPVYQGDALELEPAQFPSVRYVMIDNVLEHLSSIETAKEVLHNMTRIASQVVHVRHPSFEDTSYLGSLGLKQYWTDWPGSHRAHIRLRDFVDVAHESGVYRFLILPVRRSWNSEDSTLLPLDAPPDQGRTKPKQFEVYDPERHGPKPSVSLDRPVYFAFDIFYFTSSQVPVVRYRKDPEVEVGRPMITWLDSDLVEKSAPPPRSAPDRQRRGVRRSALG